jgi:hypothetical protein
MTDSLLREVDDAVRQEKMENLWRAIKRPLLVGAVCLIAITAGQSLYKTHQESARAAATAGLLEGKLLYDREEYAQAANSFAATASDAPANLKEMAQLWQARALLQSQQEAAGEAVLDTIISSAPASLWRDMACLKKAGLRGSVPPACLAQKDSPLHGQLQLLASAYASSNGDEKAARNAAEAALASPSLSEDAKRDARAWLGGLTSMKD